MRLAPLVVAAVALGLSPAAFADAPAQASSVSAVLSTSLTQSLAARDGLTVMSEADVRELLSREAQHQAMACEGEACVAEVADALGARLVVSARLSRLRERLQLSASVFDSTRADVVARQTVTAPSLSGIQEKVPFVAASLWREAVRAMADSGEAQSNDATDDTDDTDATNGTNKTDDTTVRLYVQRVEVEAGALQPPNAGTGLAPFSLGLTQLLAGAVGGLVVTSQCACVTPGLVGAGLVYLGDAFGTERSVLGWPLLIAYAISGPVMAVGLLLGFALPIAALTMAFLALPADTFTASRQPTDAEIQSVATTFAVGFYAGMASLFVAQAASIGGALTVPFSYAYFAEPKGPADDGRAPPGLFRPNHAAFAPEAPPPPRVATGPVAY